MHVSCQSITRTLRVIRANLIITSRGGIGAVHAASSSRSRLSECQCGATSELGGMFATVLVLRVKGLSDLCLEHKSVKDEGEYCDGMGVVTS